MLKALEYLTACHHIFERGLLGHVYINNSASPVLHSIDKGYTFFESWLTQKLAKGISNTITFLTLFEHNILFDITGYHVTKTTDREFLSWQTWDLLRITVFGFKDFTASFLQDHPGYVIYPVRLNGSAVETLFCQLKHATSSQLSCVNYPSAKASILTQGSVHGRRRCRCYRSTPLFVRQHRLKRQTSATCRKHK